MRCIRCGESTMGDNLICDSCRWDEQEDDFDSDMDWQDEEDERREQERAEYAAFCKCGAWQFAKDGSVVHVADCCCGAE